MPEADRTWTFQRVMSSLLLVCTGLLALIMVLDALWEGWSQGTSPLQHLDQGQIWTVVGMALFAASLRGQALSGRRRMERRANALDGDTSAFPLAGVAVDPSAALIDGELPLELTWRGAGLLPKRSGCVLLLIVLLPLGMVGALLSALVFDAKHVPAGVFLAVTFAGATVGAAVIVLVAKRYIERAQRQLTGRIVATKDGLTQPRGKQTPLVVRWADARLLEVIAPNPGQTFTRRFILHGSSGSISWYVVPLSGRWKAAEHADAHDDASPPRQQAFLNLVAARSGLLPRTFSPSLRPSEPVPAGAAILTPSGMPGSVYLVISLLAALLLALGAVVLLVPLTGLLPLDAAVAASFAAPAIYLIFFLARYALRQRRQLHPLAGGLPPAPSLSGSTALLVNYVSPLRRLLNSGMAALFLVDLAAVIVAFIHATTLLLTSVSTVALLGFIFALNTLKARAVHVSADLAGLRSRTGGGATSIPWEAVERVEVAPDAYGGQAFKIIAGDDGRTISWHASHARRFEPPPGAFRVSAEELAAIVVQRSGKPLTRASVE